MSIPAPVSAVLGEHRFHPALVDGAFQTLFGAPFLGQQASADPFLPARIRRFAAYAPPQPRMSVHVAVLSAKTQSTTSPCQSFHQRGVLASRSQSALAT